MINVLKYDIRVGIFGFLVLVTITRTCSCMRRVHDSYSIYIFMICLVLIQACYYYLYHIMSTTTNPHPNPSNYKVPCRCRTIACVDCNKCDLCCRCYENKEGLIDCTDCGYWVENYLIRELTCSKCSKQEEVCNQCFLKYKYPKSNPTYPTFICYKCE